MEHLSVTALIAQRPTDDTRMVLVPLHHAVDTVYVRRIPVFPISGMIDGILKIRHGTHAVVLYIGFVHHVETVTVA